VGPAKAREIYILNEKIRAKEALRIGLVSKVIPARGNAFQVQVQQIAQRLANEAPLALLRIKVCNDVVCCCCISNLTRHTHTQANFLDSDKNTSFSEHLDVETERHAKCGYHPDAMEAGKAFLSKRKPKFSNIGENRNKWEMSRL
jgi:2-(1,2-epoxy-1,2-dihydrophenyl)acetyl-CoA isomerase